MTASPSTTNYQYGAGAAFLKLDGDSEFRHVGNLKEMTYASEIQTLEHKQTMSGLKSIDFEAVTEVSASINAVLDEVSPENMALFVMGTVGDTDTGGHIEIIGLSDTTLEGQFKYVSDNPYGRNFELHCRVSIRPNGDFSFITEDLTSIPITMKVLKVAGEFTRWVFIETPAN